MLFRPHSDIKWIPDSRRQTGPIPGLLMVWLLASPVHLQPGHWLCRKMNPCLPWVRPSTSCATFMPSNNRKREYILMFHGVIPHWQCFIINVCLPDLRTPSIRLIQLCYQLSEPQRLILVALLAHYVILYKLAYTHTVWDTLVGTMGIST